MSKDFQDKVDVIVGHYENKDYSSAIKYLEQIEDIEERKSLCFFVLAVKGMEKAMVEHGHIEIISNKEKYEKAKSGMEDVSPHAVIHAEGFKPDSPVEGLEDMLDFIPEDDPLKIYYRENFEEGKEHIE